ncbi:MAG: 2-hydroxychromene-2-carboxylate isomerase [Proteobacteria bacterium]|nr:2-hydroxychromene-2-carboxylate isomerase [Pseudomonadota bacterium]
MPTIDCYFDYVSPFAHFIVEPLTALAARAGAELVWKPIPIGGLSNFAGDGPYSPQRRTYVVKDAIRCAEFYGVETNTPSPFPMNSDLALRGALAAQDAGVFDAYHRRVFRAGWSDRRDIADEAVLAECFREAGGDAEALLAEARRDETQSRVEALLAEAEARGVFGIPTAVLDDELFWGNDRLAMLEWRLQPGPGLGEHRG